MSNVIPIPTPLSVELEAKIALAATADRAARAAKRPELIINESDPTATAKELAALFARRNDFLSNGYAPVQVVVDADNMPRAVEATIELIRIYAHEICNPIKIVPLKNAKPSRGPSGLLSPSVKTLLNSISMVWRAGGD